MYEMVKSADQVELMRGAGRVVACTLQKLAALVAPGVTTAELDRVAEEFIRDQGAAPSFKGYRGYPASICTSINEAIVHGIPDARALVDGDIISIDCGAIWQGYQGDAAITVAVGTVAPQILQLMEVTRAALAAGIAAAQAGNRLGDVSYAIEQVARRGGFRVVREYGGHGIGRRMHEAPRIPNEGPAGQGIRLRAGMTLALEPMLTSGDGRTRVLADQWTVVSTDGEPSAHYEHTIVVTQDGAEILTRC